MQPVLVLLVVFIYIYLSIKIPNSYTKLDTFTVAFVAIGATISLLVALRSFVIRENYSDQICPNCNGRIVTAQVYADPDNVAGLGWVL